MMTGRIRARAEPNPSPRRRPDGLTMHRSGDFGIPPPGANHRPRIARRSIPTLDLLWFFSSRKTERRLGGVTAGDFDVSFSGCEPQTTDRPAVDPHPGPALVF